MELCTTVRQNHFAKYAETAPLVLVLWKLSGIEEVNYRLPIAMDRKIKIRLVVVSIHFTTVH
jgi:hypothetical protein